MTPPVDAGTIRVLRVIARMNVGGPALQVVELSRNLDAERFETRLLVGAVDDSEADYLELRAPDVAAVRIPGLGRELGPGDIRALPAIVREMRRFRPHIVHTHTAKAGVLGRVAARIARVPATVHTFNGHLLRGYFSPRGTATSPAVFHLIHHCLNFGGSGKIAGGSFTNTGSPGSDSLTRFL